MFLTQQLLLAYASGYREYSNGTQNNQGSNGYYWSSSVYDGNQGWICNFNSGSVNPENAYQRSYGSSVRCVQVFATLLFLIQLKAKRSF